MSSVEDRAQAHLDAHTHATQSCTHLRSTKLYQLVIRVITLTLTLTPTLTLTLTLTVTVTVTVTVTLTPTLSHGLTRS